MLLQGAKVRNISHIAHYVVSLFHDMCERTHTQTPALKYRIYEDEALSAVAPTSIPPHGHIYHITLNTRASSERITSEVPTSNTSRFISYSERNFSYFSPGKISKPHLQVKRNRLLKSLHSHIQNHNLIEFYNI